MRLLHSPRVLHRRSQRLGTVGWRSGTPAGRNPTIALMTALPEEFHAMRVFLGDVAYRKIPGDRADYLVGTLPSCMPDQPHLVALAMTGAMGGYATADSCAHMARSFPTIACTVMVGTAAGVPNPGRPERHVRLGDIVVASRGIVDYGHVVLHSDGPVLRQPFPRPSPVLARADRMIHVGELAGVRPWEAALDLINSTTLAGYARPADSTDILHDDDDGDRVLSHPPIALSGHQSGAPKVHRGRIGSADISLRSAARRDQLAARYDLIAFEMEGSGVGSSCFLNGLEWFVVRGVSDYGDRAAAIEWRRYASLTAAAYVVTLLSACPPMNVWSGQSTSHKVGPNGSCAEPNW